MINFLRNTGRALSLILASSLFSTALFAQSGSVSLRGQVTDPSGASVPAVSVTVIAPGGTALVAQTNEEGRYVFRSLPPGTYTVQIRVKGFAAFVKTGVVVTSGQPQIVDAQLAVAMEKQEVTVSDTTTKLSVNPENSASTLVLKGKDLDSLSDDPDQLQSDLQALAGPSAGPNGGQIYIDGFTGGQLPSKAAIREIRVNQNPFSAEYDRLGYGRIEIFTRPGMDQFHGQFFASGNASAFNSRDPFATQVPPYHSEFFDGNIGGPLSKKASFFFDGERRNIQGASVVSAVILDPNFNPIPFSQAVLTPRIRTEITPRLDYQVTTSNTLTVRYQFWQNKVTNSGIGQFSLPSLGYNSGSTEHTLQVSDSQALGDRAVNETRFRYRHESDNTTPLSLQPMINVLGAFQAGGNSQGKSADTTNRYELQNYTGMTLGKHSLRFGARLRDVDESDQSTANFNGTFTFPSLTAYQSTEQGLQQGWTPAQIRAAGGGASQFVIVTGKPLARVNLIDLGLYGEDNWRLRPNMTLSLGLRFETQNGIHDHADVAPRIGFAWGMGGGRNPKTVLRAGFGIFYDRFQENQVLQAERLNGVTQQQYVVTSPDFYPVIPDPSALVGSQTYPTIYQIAPHLRAPYAMQSGAGIERQVTKNATVSVTYLNTHGLHQLRTRNINAPLPGTYVLCSPGDSSCTPSSGVRPYGDVGNIYQYESAGLFNQNQVIANYNVRMGTKLSLFGFYTLNYAKSNTAGVDRFPMNQYNLREDYGRAAFDVRHRLFLGGSFGLPYGFRISPFMMTSSGMPFSITLGQDVNGDSIFNDRPGLATGSSGPSIVVTRFGTFDKNPGTGETIVPPNFVTGPSQFSLNLRLAKTFGFGKKKEQGATGGGFGGGPHGGPRGGGLGGRGLSGGGGFFGFGSPSNARYNLEFSVSARNMLNNVNLASPIGNLNSPLFGRSNGLAGGGPFGGGGGFNRRLDVQVRFTF